ncbi:collagen alpha-3(VI) chain-like [Sander lucioperca]|uniref:collagen alpha-3(VI) chain-like n=1 Tax=Sander lucioperca TaxID=283035 RepID=UPI001653DEA1|nr:collagen alpha-3(VI) chain-like [Sander lucioperca]
MLVVMGAGPSTDDTGAGDRALKRASVITFGVAIGDTASADLEAVATDKSFVLSAPDFRTVASTGDQLLPFINGVVQRTIIVQNEFTEVLAVGPRDIIFLIDSTMGATLINSVREFIKRFVNIMPIGPDGVQVGVAQFSNIPRLEMDLNSYGSREELTAALGSIKPRPGQTVNIGAALDFVRTNMLRPEKGSRIQQRVPQVLLLMTSKKSSDSVEAPAIALQQLGVLTLAAGSKTATENELQQIAFDDTVAFYLKDFRSLLHYPKAIVDALSTIAGVVVTGGPTEPVMEITTVQTQKVVRDIVFLVDGSNYVGSSNFPYVRAFILNVVNQLDVRPDRVRIGLLQFAESQNIEFHLNSYSSRQDVVNKISQLRLTGGSVLNTGAAMNYALANMFQPSTGSRRKQGVQQVLVLITGGPVQDQAKNAADKLALAGVLTFTVSSGQADEALMRTVAFVEDLAYHETSFSNLPALAEQIMPKLITVVGDTDVTETTFPVETVLAVGPRDIIFLIDSTMGATLINSVREFIKRFVNIMPIGPDGVQVGVAQFSNIPRLEMDLNSYGSREELTAALGSIKPRPGQTVNIGAALDFVRTNMLRPEKGSRIQQGVPQVLLLMTSKKSSDSVEAPAIALQRLGVLTLAAGSKTATENELRQIAFADSVAFYLKDFRSLLRYPKATVDALSTLAGVVVTEGPTEPVMEITTVQTQKVVRDIVFLVDGSNYVGSSNFSYVRAFILNVVNQLDVRPDRVRIGLLQFAESQNIEFHLNSYSSRQDVVNKISQLRLTGGSVLNTGAAMNYALANMFQPSTGSRRKQGVQQVLVLITGGPVQDQAKNTADKLALAGVLTFTVSSGQADEALMRTVAFVEDLAYHETSFSNLPALAEQIMPKLITVVGDTDVTQTIPEETDVVAGAERDVAFLIDGTENVRRDFAYI